MTSTKKTQYLQSIIEGEVYTDTMQLAMYSTDASNYQIFPSVVVVPKHKQDVIEAVKWAVEQQMPILGRGGGTSLVGQTVGEGMILDFTKYMNQILEVNPDQHWARVQPGIVRDVLNVAMAKHNLHFAPDPATSSRATVGGMIANNSSGTRSILYGKTIDHTLELEVLLSDGTVIQCTELNLPSVEQKCTQDSREAVIYKFLTKIIANNSDEIKSRFPKVMRRVGGYNLDEFLGDSWNLSDIICGSESTLGIILEAKINLAPNPKHQALVCVHFEEFFDSIAHVSEMVSFKPAAVELLDHMLLQLSRENMETKHYCSFIDGDPGGMLVVEFFADTAEAVAEKAYQLQNHLKEKKIGYAQPVFLEKKKIDDVLTVRKKGLGLLLGVKGNRKPIAFIEDAAVPLEHLPVYIKEVFEVCKKYETPVVAYAHASVGLLHVKPLLDLRDAEDIERMKHIANECLDLVIKYKGSWSGEHGDGLARGAFNEKFFGTRLYNVFKEVKQLFDPYGLMNPGKVIETPPMDQQLRYGTQYKDAAYQPMFKYRSENGFHEAVHLCNGVGECRKMSGGTMCPSFRATCNEQDSTRGRANVLRLALSNQIGTEQLASKEVIDAMDLCISCKACKSECPSNVDMSKFKSEVLHRHTQQHGLKLRDRLLLWQNNIAAISTGPQAVIVNAILKSIPFRYLLEKTVGLERKRILPAYTNKKFNTNSKKGSGKKVVFFVDTYIKYHEPEIGHKLIQILESYNYEVIIYDAGCCQRPALSHGLLDAVSSKGKQTLDDLMPYMQQQIPIVICEPSCLSALKEDVPDLMDDEVYAANSNSMMMIEDFIVQEWKAGNIKSLPEMQQGSYLLHGHCHQKALYGTNSVHQLFKDRITEIPSGCCGMAGSFGYEKEHYHISEQIGELSVFKPIRAAGKEVHVIAQGFSCRHQIEHFADREAKHWLCYVK